MIQDKACLLATKHWNCHSVTGRICLLAFRPSSLFDWPDRVNIKVYRLQHIHEVGYHSISLTPFIFQLTEEPLNSCVSNETVVDQ